MELQKLHREAFLDRLKELEEAINVNRAAMRSAEEKKDDVHIYMEAGLFLLESERELIKKSLIDNEIDW